MFGLGKTVELNFVVEGMMCEHCAGRVREALLAVRGVKAAEVDLTNKRVGVKMKDGVTKEDIQKAVEGAGYKVVFDQ